MTESSYGRFQTVGACLLMFVVYLLQGPAKKHPELDLWKSPYLLRSNPQNLDISSMIAVPSESPFAMALRTAKQMLLIPNGQMSIYTRAKWEFGILFDTFMLKHLKHAIISGYLEGFACD